jgi:Na+-driven multidrug efflux pump
MRSPTAPLKLSLRVISHRRELLSDILKMGVPSIINMVIMNMSIVVLTGIAGQFGPSAAIGYAMGARLEYILQPIVFSFGLAMVTMVGTNWGAGQFKRARRIAWAGSILSAASCGIIGLVVSIYPSFWVGLFSDEPEALRIGALYLQTVGPVYWCFGLGFALYAALLSYSLQQIKDSKVENLLTPVTPIKNLGMK